MQVFYKGHPSFHSWAMIKQFAVALISAGSILLIILFLKNNDIISSSLFYLVALFDLLLGLALPLLWRHNHLYLVTDRGVSCEYGFIIRSNRRDISLRRIQVLDVKQNIFDKLIFRTGDVYIDSAARDDYQDAIHFQGISKPHRVYSLIRDCEENLYDSRSEGDFYNPYSEGEYRPAPGMGQQGVSGPPGPAPWDRSSEPAPWDRGPSDPYSGEQDYGSRPPLPPS